MNETEKLVEELVNTLAAARRPHGYVVASTAHMDRLLENILQAQALTAGKPDREAVARIVDPVAFGDYPDHAIDPRYGSTWANTRFAMLARADAILATLPVEGPNRVDGWRPTHRHIGRGTLYQVIGLGRTQHALKDFDDTPVTIYRGEDFQVWVRPTAEFNDGRFEPLPQAPGEGR